jgi:hypothetical protein
MKKIMLLFIIVSALKLQAYDYFQYFNKNGEKTSQSKKLFECIGRKW